MYLHLFQGLHTPKVLYMYMYIAGGIYTVKHMYKVYTTVHVQCTCTIYSTSVGGLYVLNSSLCFAQGARNTCILYIMLYVHE